MIYCNLAGLMANKKVNISEVSRKTRISRTTLTSLYYNNFKGIQTDTANTLCRYFNVGMDKLFLFSKYDIKIHMYLDGSVCPCQTEWNQLMITFETDNGISRSSYDFYANCYFGFWTSRDDENEEDAYDETEENTAGCNVSFECFLDTGDDRLTKQNNALKEFFNSLSDEIRACVINNIETKAKEVINSAFDEWNIEYTFDSEIW